VRPPFNSIAAMPEEATATQTFCWDLHLASSVLRTNVFPVPPGASKKIGARGGESDVEMHYQVCRIQFSGLH